MKSKRIYLTLAIGLVIVMSLVGAAGCDSDSTPTDGALFSDDFSQDRGDWEVYSDADGEVFYDDGWLHVINYTTSPIDTVTLLDGNFSDFVMEVDTKLVDGTDDNWHGIICRYQDDANYYAFAISADGYYLITKFADAAIVDLEPVTQSEHIDQGWDTVNSVRIECNGNRLTLSVNGHVLGSVTDSTFSSGQIGLTCTSWGGTFSQIAFDNLVISEP